MGRKSYLKGLGVGVLLTTFVFMAVNALKPDSGYSYSSKETTSSSISDISKSSQAASSTENTSSAEKDTTVQSQPETQPQTQPVTAAPTLPPPTTATKAPPETEAPQQIIVELNNINSSERAAQILAERGVITDWRDFNNYLVNNGYSTRIQDGTHIFNKNEDYEVIARRITGR